MGEAAETTVGLSPVVRSVGLVFSGMGVLGGLRTAQRRDVRGRYEHHSDRWGPWQGGAGC